MPNDSRETYALRKQAQTLYPFTFGEVCEICLKPVAELHRHHLNSDIGDNRPENIQKICGGCHNRIEPRKKRKS